MSVLLIDDEPEYFSWLVEFFESLSESVSFATSLSGGLDQLGKKKYDLLIIDLNLPAGGTLIESVANKGPLGTKYPGLIICRRARTMGYKAREVIAYTVHHDQAVEGELANLDVAYVLKGRPQVLKETVRHLFSKRK
jgi:CheY-like chemotaxis protein